MRAISTTTTLAEMPRPVDHDAVEAWLRSTEPVAAPSLASQPRRIDSVATSPSEPQIRRIKSVAANPHESPPVQRTSTAGLVSIVAAATALALIVASNAALDRPDPHSTSATMLSAITVAFVALAVLLVVVLCWGWRALRIVAIGKVGSIIAWFPMQILGESLGKFGAYGDRCGGFICIFSPREEYYMRVAMVVAFLVVAAILCLLRGPISREMGIIGAVSIAGASGIEAVRLLVTMEEQSRMAAAYYAPSPSLALLAPIVMLLLLAHRRRRR